MKRILIFVLFFYLLVLIQTSFLIHFNISSVVPNLILISVILVNFFEKAWKNTGLLIAAIGGFYLDLFSNFQLGISLFTLIILAFLIKRALKILREKNILYFIPIFIFAVIFYNLVSTLFSSVLRLSFPPSFAFNKLKMLEIIYNLGIGVFGFYLIKLCSGKILRK